ncbi:MAG: Mn2+/Fe2+ NRAMP family transporter [Planctomycetota bacterium]|jgi:Mn2+/Fe2+ NRAMP family transporter
MDRAPSSDEARLKTAHEGGVFSTLLTYARLSGPGWLQSAITLGGGSLAGALFLGVLTGTRMLWLQLLAMLLGVVMLSAISYVTLCTGERPFGAIKKHVNPVLAWGWATAVLMANVVWCLPQFSLATAAVQKNLLPGFAGDGAKVAICAALLGAAVAAVWAYDSGSRGLAVFEVILKGLVGLIVVCFFGVVWALASGGEGFEWGRIAQGLVPSWSSLTEPAPLFADALGRTGTFQGWWSARIVSEQQSVAIAAAATAVGINMTFLLPYSMLRKGWNVQFRRLAVFDLGTGLLIPFVLATGCVVIASADRFHGKYDTALVEEVPVALASKGFLTSLDARLQAGLDADSYAMRSVHPRERAGQGEEAYAERVALAMAMVPRADRELCAMLVRRDSFALAKALEPLAGPRKSQLVFGVGVLAMALSTIIVLMMISGFVVAEMLGMEPRGWPYRLGALLAGVGVLGPFVWADHGFWLAVPTSNFGMVLLPIAYWTFVLMMNSKSLMGERRPRGIRRVVWNVAMSVAAGTATLASIFTVNAKVGLAGHVGVVLFLGAALVAHFVRKGKRIS